MAVKGNIPDIKKRAVLEIGHALEREIENRKNADTEEATERKKKDTELDGKITKEIADRTEADTTEKNAREAADTELEGKITQEISDREQADSSLESKLNKEIADRKAADNTEKSAREAKDTELDGKITAEETARENADNTEKAAREKKDTELDGKITKEISDREEADERLQAEIDAIPENIVTGESDFEEGRVIVGTGDGKKVKQSEFSIEASVPPDAKFTDTVYTHPKSAAGAKTAGLYKITTDATGHVTAATTVTKEDITDLGVPGSDTVYTHPTSAAGAKPSGLYKITTDATGHVTGAVEVKKSDITDLGIPESDTVYTHPTSKAGAKGEGLYKITTDATGHVTAATTVTADDITALGITGGGDVPDNIVTADKTFNTDEIIVAAENGRGVKSSEVKLSELSTGGEAPVNVVTASEALTSGKLIAGAGERGVEATNIDANKVVYGLESSLGASGAVIISQGDNSVVSSGKQIADVVTATDALTAEHVVTATGKGKAVKDSGFTIGKSVPADAEFTDTTYDDATTSKSGLMSAADKQIVDKAATSTDTHAQNEIPAFKSADTNELTGSKINAAYLLDAINIAKDPKMNSLILTQKSDIFPIAWYDKRRPAYSQIAIKKGTSIEYFAKVALGTVSYTEFETRLKYLSTFGDFNPSVGSAIYNVNGADYYIIALAPQRVLYWDTEKSTMGIDIMNNYFNYHPENFLKCVPLMVTGTFNRGPDNNTVLNTENIPETADATRLVADQLYRNGELIGGVLYDYANANAPITEGWESGTWKEFE